MSPVDLFSVVQKDNKLQVPGMSQAAPGRVTVASQTLHLPLMKPFQSFYESGQPGLWYVRAPLPFSAGLSTSHSPPNNYTNLLQPDSPPLERQGGRVGKSTNSHGHSTCLLPILRCYALSLPCAPGGRLWQARQLFCR